MNEKISKGIKD